jgi:thiamine-phosphate pyrophosphorylase
VICLVTDRYRLAARLALDPDSEQILERLERLIAVGAEAGVDLVQVRDGSLSASVLAGLVRRLVATVRSTATRIVVNDRFDVALAAGAHGLHLKDASIDIQRIRASAQRGFLIGQSIHSADRAPDVAADYAIFGTVFATRSKPGAEAAGLTALERVVRRARVPVLAIGGVKVEHFDAIAATGAGGFAAVDVFLPSGPDSEPALRDIVDRAHFTFGAGARRPV